MQEPTPLERMVGELAGTVVAALVVSAIDSELQQTPPPKPPPTLRQRLLDFWQRRRAPKPRL